MAFRMFDKKTAVGVSYPVKLNLDIGVKDHTIHVSYSPTDVTPVTALIVKFQGSHTDADAHTGVVTPAGLTAASSGGGSGIWPAIGTTFYYLINDTFYTGAAATAGAAFSAIHVIGNGADDLYGAINVYIDSGGVLRTIVPGVQTGAQVYTTSALAYAAAADWVRGTQYPLTYCPVGRLIIRANAKTWTANTDDLTAGSDLTSIQFVSFASTFKDIVTYPFTADDLTAMGAMFSYKGINPKWVRLFLSTLTGAARVSARYFPEDSP